MPGCWKDWNGLEEVTEVTEGLEWEEEIGRTSHTLKLQELGGYFVLTEHLSGISVPVQQNHKCSCPMNIHPLL